MDSFEVVPKVVVSHCLTSQKQSYLENNSIVMLVLEMASGFYIILGSFSNYIDMRIRGNTTRDFGV